MKLRERENVGTADLAVHRSPSPMRRHVAAGHRGVGDVEWDAWLIAPLLPPAQVDVPAGAPLPSSSVRLPETVLPETVLPEAVLPAAAPGAVPVATAGVTLLPGTEHRLGVAGRHVEPALALMIAVIGALTAVAAGASALSVTPLLAVPAVAILAALVPGRSVLPVLRCLVLLAGLSACAVLDIDLMPAAAIGAGSVVAVEAILLAPAASAVVTVAGSLAVAIPAMAAFLAGDPAADPLLTTGLAAVAGIGALGVLLARVRGSVLADGGAPPVPGSGVAKECA